MLQSILRNLFNTIKQIKLKNKTINKIIKEPSFFFNKNPDNNSIKTANNIAHPIKNPFIDNLVAFRLALVANSSIIGIIIYHKREVKLYIMMKVVPICKESEKKDNALNNRENAITIDRNKR